MNKEGFWGFLKEKKFLFLVGVFLVLVIAYGALLLSEVKGKKVEKKQYSEENITEAFEPKLLVTKVEPYPDQTGVSTAPTIKIYFDRAVKNLSVAIGTQPEFGFQSALSPESFNTTLTPTATLSPNTKYTIEVKLEKATIYRWSFTTGSTDTPADTAGKIKKALPFRGDHFVITYWSSTDKFFVSVDAQPYMTYKNEALDWFRQQGLTDPEKQINIVFIPPGEAN